MPPSTRLSAEQIHSLNSTAAFNAWCAFEVLESAEGRAVLGMTPRAEQGQYAGYLHAGVIGALIDTACGFAAATVAGMVMASHFSVNCIRPAVGRRFEARARVLRSGRSQIFTSCELIAFGESGEPSLVATGETLLVPVPA